MGVSIFGFWIFALSQVGTPGPANMILLTTGARFGLRSALPFVLGVVFSKQLIIWPIGFGLMGLASSFPAAFVALKYVSAAYILWLAWRVAGSSLKSAKAISNAPTFLQGLPVHPLNPKAWAMITAGFTNFVDTSAPTIASTAIIAGILMLTQLILHPLWAGAGSWLAERVAGYPAERWLMRSLALMTVLSVGFVLFLGQEG